MKDGAYVKNLDGSSILTNIFRIQAYDSVMFGYWINWFYS